MSTDLPPVRDLIKAFSEAVRPRLTSRGWRKRSGEIYTFDLSDGFYGWLGLNRAANYRPLQINPVVGLRYEPLMRLVAELYAHKERYGPSVTISSPVGYLTPERRFLQLSIDSFADVDVAADELARLVDDYGLPFARNHATLRNLERAMEDGKFVAGPEDAMRRLPALHAVSGRYDEARAAAANFRSSLSDRSDLAAQQGRAYLAALTAWIDAKTTNQP